MDQLASVVSYGFGDAKDIKFFYRSLVFEVSSLPDLLVFNAMTDS